MNRRKMLEPGVWLKCLGPEDRYCTMAYPCADARSTADLMADLVDKTGYMVEIDQGTLGFRVSLLPLRGRVPLGQPPVRILYRGTDVRSILATAVHELGLLRSRQYQYQVSTKEVERWVP